MDPQDVASTAHSAPPVESESYTYPRLQVPLFGSEYVEYARRQLFTRHPDYLPTLVRLMDLHPGMTAVDVGCGSGFYTRLMASQMRGEGQVVGIDPHPGMLRAASERTIVEGWDEIVRYYAGTITALPAPDAAADLVFANGQLWTLPEQQRIPALREMGRIAKIGGRVLVAEPDGGLVHVYDAERPRLQELEELLEAAFMRGAERLDGFDYRIGRRLPTLFHAAGFERVRVYPRLFVVAGCDLGPDPKQGLKDRVIEYRQAMLSLTSDTPEIRARRERRAERQRAGGATDEQIAEHTALTIDRLQMLLDHPERIIHDTSIYLYGGLFCEGYRT